MSFEMSWSTFVEFQWHAAAVWERAVLDRARRELEHRAHPLSHDDPTRRSKLLERGRELKYFTDLMVTAEAIGSNILDCIHRPIGEGPDNHLVAMRCREDG